MVFPGSARPRKVLGLNVAFNVSWCGESVMVLLRTGREHNTLSHRQKPRARAVMTQHTPVMSVRRLKSEVEWTLPAPLLRSTSRGRLQFAGKPAAHLGLHRILRHADRMNLTALLALESAAIESIRSRCDFGKQHTGFAFRATRPLNIGKMRRSYGLILGHRISLHAAGALPNSLSPITAKRAR